MLPALANIRCSDRGKGGGREAPQAGGGGGAPQAGGGEGGAAGGTGRSRVLETKKNFYINFIWSLNICYVRLE